MFDRFDICEAHYALEVDYNVGGVLQERPSNQRRNMSTDYQLHRMGFRPSPLFNGFDSRLFDLRVVGEGKIIVAAKTDHPSVFQRNRRAHRRGQNAWRPQKACLGEAPQSPLHLFPDVHGCIILHEGRGVNETGESPMGNRRQRNP